VSGAVFWISCKTSPPAIMYSNGWKEPKNYIRPEEDAGAMENGVSAEGDNQDMTEGNEFAQETATSKD
jgi:hypothetical protein